MPHVSLERACLSDNAPFVQQAVHLSLDQNLTVPHAETVTAHHATQPCFTQNLAYTSAQQRPPFWKKSPPSNAQQGQQGCPNVALQIRGCCHSTALRLTKLRGPTLLQNDSLQSCTVRTRTLQTCTAETVHAHNSTASSNRSARFAVQRRPPPKGTGKPSSFCGALRACGRGAPPRLVGRRGETSGRGKAARAAAPLSGVRGAPHQHPRRSQSGTTACASCEAEQMSCGWSCAEQRGPRCGAGAAHITAAG